MDANLNVSQTSPSLRRMEAVCRNSSADSGSSGCCAMSESPLSRGIRTFADTHVPLCDDIAGLKLNDGQSGISEISLVGQLTTTVKETVDWQVRHRTGFTWWAQLGSNQCPLACKM